MFHDFVACIVSDEKSAIILILSPDVTCLSVCSFVLYQLFLFFLFLLSYLFFHYFYVLPFYLCSSAVLMMCIDMIFSDFFIPAMGDLLAFGFVG